MREKRSQWLLRCFAFVAVMLPDTILLLVFSAMGNGHLLYGAVADSSANLGGNGFGLLSFFVAGLLFIFDFQVRGVVVQVSMACVLASFCFAAALLKGVSYPWVPMLLCKCMIPCLLLPVRIEWYYRGEESFYRESFYRAAFVCFLTCAVLGLSVWFAWMGSEDRFWTSDTRYWLADRNEDLYAYVYTNESNASMVLSFRMHCDEASRDHAAFTEAEVTDITAACSKARGVWYLQWCCPFVSAFINFVAAGFCVLFGRVVALKAKAEIGVDTHHLIFILRVFVLVLAVSVAFMYCSLYVSGTSATLGSAILGLGFAATTIFNGWIYFEVDHDLLKRVMMEAPRSILNILESEWVRAFAVIGLNVFIPILALLDMARQTVRRSMAKDVAQHQQTFTHEGKQIVDMIERWDLCSIFGKVNIIAEVFILLLIGTKLTFVFFSGLNAALSAAALAFGMVTVLVAVTGYVMFLIPIVPGSAVYLFAGVVLAGQAQPPYGTFGFWPAVVVACVVGTFAKFMACLSQYSIGYLSGKRVSVQQFVGVDTVPIRAMEQILKQSGMKLGKVCILVAGPDWPTSVLCGILRLNIPQMLLGTSPVILVSIIPQTIVGALLVRTGSDASVWALISTAATGLAAAFQAGATMIFTFKLMLTVEEDSKHLAEPREEHKEVAALTAKQEEYMAKYREATSWKELSTCMRTLSLASVVCFLSSVFTMAVDNQMSDDEHFCFLPFAITDNISADVEVGGLGDEPLAVILPIGWGALGVAALGFCLGVVFGRLARNKALDAVTPVVPCAK